jgi:hypothetical protein
MHRERAPRSLAALALALSGALLLGCSATAPPSPSAVARSPSASASASGAVGSVEPTDVEAPLTRPLPPQLAFLEPDLNSGIPTATVKPESSQVTEGERSGFSLGHCGLASPIDYDGSLWDVVGAQDLSGGPLTEAQIGDLINQTQGVIVVEGDRGEFLSRSRALVELRRHQGAKEYPLCS